MGYKSVLRSVSASANRSVKESERQARQEAKRLEKIQKKINKANDQMKKVHSSLEDIYAKGKLKKEDYKKLCERKSKITIDFILFGKTPYISLAKRFVTGKIDDKEYEEIMLDVLANELIEEKKEISTIFNNKIRELESFLNGKIETEIDNCEICNFKKTFFKRLKKIDELRLCGKCRTKLKKLKNYKGYYGTYFTVSPKKININDQGLMLNININNSAVEEFC